MAPQLQQSNSHQDNVKIEYLAQLLKDKKQFQGMPSVFFQAEKLLDKEINKVRCSLFNTTPTTMELPEAVGECIQMSEKLFIPQKQHVDFNFVGRILGPRGMTAKQLEQDTGCKIMIRGRGSMRDKQKEEQFRNQKNWDHLTEELHVLITVEDTENRASVKIAKAVERVEQLLIPSAEGEDELKKMQLLELAILNGNQNQNDRQKALLQAASVMSQQPFLRHSLQQLPLRTPPMMHRMAGTSNVISPQLGPLMSPNETSPTLYYPNPYFPTDAQSPPNLANHHNPLMDLSHMDHATAAAVSSGMWSFVR